jgi:beta-glucuronidase
MLNLDGIWEFAWTEDITDTPHYNSFAAVPGAFDAEGLRFNQRGVGWYRRKIIVSDGKQRLKIGSFGLRAAVFLDDKMLNESAFAWSPLVTDFSTKAGEHELVIRVDNYAGDHPLFMDRYDFYGFGGIFDHVTLSEVPQHEIRTLEILPLDHTNGEVLLRIDTEAPVLRIAFDNGQELSFENTRELRLHVPDFQPWTPEHPFLHMVRVNERIEEFGIRTLDWSGSQLKLNGKVIKLLGINRHEEHPQFGPATPESLIMSDLLRIKQAGMNFIRGAHYPQREFVFKACDRLGLMVWEEPLSWGNLEDKLQEQCFLDALADQLAFTIHQSFNHPSLIIHGFLNECASDTDAGIKAVARMMDICHKLDPSRPATFATNRPNSDRCLHLVDIAALNVYPGWYGDQDICDIPEALDKFSRLCPDKPMVISEIGAAAMYGSHSEAPYVPWTEEFQSEYISSVMKSVLENPAWSGVMLWMFCNANTYTGAAYKIVRPRCYNNKGLLDEYRRPKLAWHTLRQILQEKSE